jgi:hypothetical protein
LLVGRGRLDAARDTFARFNADAQRDVKSLGELSASYDRYATSDPIMIAARARRLEAMRKLGMPE